MTVIVDPGYNRVVAGDMARFFKSRAAHYKGEQEQKAIVIAGPAIYEVTMPKRGISHKHYDCSENLAGILERVSSNLVAGVRPQRILDGATVFNHFMGGNRNIFFSLSTELPDTITKPRKAVAISDKAVAAVSLHYLRTLESFLSAYKGSLEPARIQEPTEDSLSRYRSAFGKAAQSQRYGQEKSLNYTQYLDSDRQVTSGMSPVGLLDFKPFAKLGKPETEGAVSSQCPGMLRIWNEAFDYLLQRMREIERRYPDIWQPGFVVEGKDYIPY